MTAIAERIQKRLQSLPALRAARLEHLLEELLDFSESEITGSESSEESRRQEGLAALNRIAARGGIAGISDPMAWQREIRADRELPGRGL